MGPEPAATFLHDVARPLFFLHTVAAIAVVGLTVHLLWFARPIVLGRPGRVAAVRKLVAVAFWCTLAAVAFGLLLYPEYKANIRVLFLDRRAPAVGLLFDIKEYAAILSVPLLGFLFAARRELTPEASRELRGIYGGVLGLWTLAVWIAAVLGWYTTTVRSLGVPG